MFLVPIGWRGRGLFVLDLAVGGWKRGGFLDFFQDNIRVELLLFSIFLFIFLDIFILGDPGADSGDEGKCKRAEKCGTKKSKERREEPLGTMSYQTSSKRSPPFWLLIGARKRQVFWHQAFGNVVDKKHMTHPLPSAQK